MAEIVIRHMNSDVLERLQVEARRCGISVEDLVRQVIERHDSDLRSHSRTPWDQINEMAKKVGPWRGPSPAEVIREGRDTDWGRER